MPIYGKNRFYIHGIEKILKHLSLKRGEGDCLNTFCIYVTTGMDILEIYSMYFSHRPSHYSIFITDERHFNVLNCLFPGLIKLSLEEKLGVDELRHAMTIMTLLAEQNQSTSYHTHLPKLTAAEEHIMQLSLRGHSLNEIGRIRGVSPTTISVQRSGLMKRTGTKNLLELCSLYRAIQSLEL
ncbi:helix-turn-helix transcriptional regulator [Klebsiella grimontii]|uniref:helix-turn-helix transcriptional regulator n=1 Tax=Klebsiella grimontii TaxID=2058152 RepID=UPI001170411A|nr:LuxR C-terminal-related transcriptional regulator [Klebsiella grimontii]VUS40908.1 hypothetical protein SPARK1531C2_04907 [Klebsiella grimontii]